MNDGNLIFTEELETLIEQSELIFRIGSSKRTLSEKLQLLIMKLIILLWTEDEENESIERMEEKLKLIDDIRHELAFLRARYYKKVFTEKSGLTF